MPTLQIKLRLSLIGRIKTDTISVRSTYLTEMATQYTRQQLNEIATKASAEKRAKYIQDQINFVNKKIYESAMDGLMDFMIVIKQISTTDSIIEGVKKVYPDIQYKVLEYVRHYDEAHIVFEWPA